MYINKSITLIIFYNRNKERDIKFNFCLYQEQLLCRSTTNCINICNDKSTNACFVWRENINEAVRNYEGQIIHHDGNFVENEIYNTMYCCIN